METAVSLATVPAILALVNLAKTLGVSGKWAALLAVILGVLVSALDALATGGDLYQAITAGLILGLSASGLYDAARLASPARDIPAADLNEPEGIIDATSAQSELLGVVSGDASDS